MTDAEIKKALECCADSSNSVCHDCPYRSNSFERHCSFQLSYDALDLINRQQAEIERLQNECFCIANERDAIKDCIDTAVEEAKSEATEQLSKKIESKLANNTDISIAQYQSIILDISEACKEMVGDADV